MRNATKAILWTAVLTAAAELASAATGISTERSGLGLKPGREPTSWYGSVAARSELSTPWHASEGGGDVVYSGARQAMRLGLWTREFYSGIYHPLGETWGTALEMGVIQSSPLAPRRYSLLGRLQRELDGGSSVSIGLKYRVYEPDFGGRLATPGETTPNGYALVPLRPSGMAPGPTYQVQLNYQYSPATSFGFVLGRELETYTPGFEQPGAAPRQLTFTGQHWLTPSWALSYDVLSNDPNSFRLQGLRFGMRYRF